MADNHDMSRNVPIFIDGIMKDHFKELIGNNLLNNKPMVFLGDHG